MKSILFKKPVLAHFIWRHIFLLISLLPTQTVKAFIIFFFFFFAEKLPAWIIFVAFKKQTGSAQQLGPLDFFVWCKKKIQSKLKLQNSLL